MILAEEIMGRLKITKVSRTIAVDVGIGTEIIIETTIWTNIEMITEIHKETTT